ncbi:MAG TPA: hypothetical protein VLD18_16270 [Verrucomicrobiae bacterium]|nr:hypothetical protein [Verrucomicrobiae bacterium]
MDTSHELASAIKEVAGQRHAVMAALQLDPNVFDSWLQGAAVNVGAPPDPHALRIISTWIRGLPELQAARDTILRACEPPEQGDPPAA